MGSLAEVLLNPPCLLYRVSKCLLCGIISRFGNWMVRLPDMLAVSSPSLLYYLGWSSARVNYRGAPVSCATKDG